MSLTRKILKESSAEKRYVVRTEFYIYAKSDDEAISQAKDHCTKQDRREDDGCSIVLLVEQPFGTIGNRPIINVE